MLDDELRTILRDLAVQTRALAAAITPSGEDERGAGQSREGEHVRAPLGFGSVLEVELPGQAGDLARGAIERATRSIRAAARRWEATELPALKASGAPTDQRQQVLERIRAFLSGFCGSTGADVAAVVHRGELVASSAPLDELQSERLSFITRLADAEASKQVGTSHAVIFQPDYFAATFYYGAALIAFTSYELAEDFVRQHARRVTRELIHLLELLDDEPPDPAHIMPT